MIGEIARRTNTKVATVRFYEQIGLLREASRTGSGRRTYDVSDLRRLTFIRHARSLGFPVEDVRALLELDDQPDRPCADADRLARMQLAAIEEKIERLTRLRGELRRISDRCAGGLAANCQVIEALADQRHCEDAHFA